LGSRYREAFFTVVQIAINCENIVNNDRRRMPSDEKSSVPRLLVCEDSHSERIAVAHLLRDSGYSVDEAPDGAAAIEYVKQWPVDLVLLDLQMPGTDGFKVLSYLQQHHRSLAVILLSGMPVNRIQHKMHGLPTPELPPLLIKPFNVEQLLALVELQLNGQLPQSSVGAP